MSHSRHIVEFILEAPAIERRYRAPAHEQLNRSVPFAKLSAEQVATMSAAIKTVLYHRDGEDDRKLRALVTRVVLAIANLGDFDKETLTILAIEKLGEPARKSA